MMYECFAVLLDEYFDHKLLRPHLYIILLQLRTMKPPSPKYKKIRNSESYLYHLVTKLVMCN